MIILKGKHGGFCFGVKRAVDGAINLLKGEGSYILGEIIHNDSVVEKLKQSGAIIIDSIFDPRLKKGDTLLIRTHGESKKVFDKANEIGLNILDFTCPFVKEIQNIVKEHYSNGYKIAIIGKKDHPEIVGINGWCDDSALITENYEDLNNFQFDKLCVVVQTTYSEDKFNKIIENFTYSKAKTVDIFKTICYTTNKRQSEANVLSKNCQAIIVLGGAKSNNTQKLFEICKQNCENVFRIVNPAQFDYEKIKSYNKIGIVMGASTPIEQFQEVISFMEKVTEEVITTETVESAVQEEVVEKAPEVQAKSEFEKAFDSIKPGRDLKIGQVVSATITSATDAGLTLKIRDAKRDDLPLPKEEIIGDYKKEDYQAKVGEKIRVMVAAKNPIVFSEKKMEKIFKEEAEIEEIKNGKIFEAEITETNKGGLIGKYGSYQVFVPSSQIRLGFVKELDKYIGKKLRLKAEKVEARGARKQIVGSQKVILEAEKAERDAIKAAKEAEFFGSIQEGDVVIGTPVRFASFGTFVDVNGFDCLAHISDLSWTGCKDCAEVLELNKQYEFIILKIDVEGKRVSIGYKQLQPKPWETVADKYNVGDVIKGKVVRLVSFGAFVEVEKGIDALVHVSQISNQWLENAIGALEVGQEIEAKIVDINIEKEKMNLSIKALLPEEEKPVQEEKPAKGKKRAPKTEEVEEEIREWKDNSDGGASIAEMIGNSEN